jgi:RNA polymerase sigma-70 factor (ECF subfamily)
MELRKNLATLLESPGERAGCPELARELSDYASQEIDQAACARIEEHLAGCKR